MLNTTLDMLTHESVSVLFEKTIEFNGKIYDDGTYRKAYVNSAKGREELLKELPVEDQQCVLVKWGNTSVLSETE